jgi:hypothetical protein
MATQRTTTTDLPPDFQIPFLERGFELSDLLLRNPPEVFAGPGIAPQSPDTLQALEAGRTAAGDFSQFLPQIFDAFSGSFNTDIASIPEFQNLAGDITSRANRNFREELLPGITSSFGAAGAFGGSDQALAVARGANRTTDSINESISNLGANFFNTQAASRSAALGALPNLVNANAAPFNLLGNIGGFQDQRAQSELSDVINTFEQQQQAPEDALDRFLARVSGGIGNTSTTSVPTRSATSSGIAGGLGGAAIGAGLGLGFPGILGAGLLGGLAGLL